MSEFDLMLVDQFMSRYDVTIAEHAIVHRDRDLTFRAACDLDFMTVRTPLLDLAMSARGLPARLFGRAPEPPPRLVLSKGDRLPGWLILGEQTDRELVFGAVGKFW